MFCAQNSSEHEYDIFVNADYANHIYHPHEFKFIMMAEDSSTSKRIDYFTSYFTTDSYGYAKITLPDWTKYEEANCVFGIIVMSESDFSQYYDGDWDKLPFNKNGVTEFILEDNS